MFNALSQCAVYDIILPKYFYTTSFDVEDSVNYMSNVLFRGNTVWTIQSLTSNAYQNIELKEYKLFHDDTFVELSKTIKM